MTNKAMKGLGLAAAILAFLVGQFWGVPYYIRYVVAEENKAHDEAAVLPAELVTLIAVVEANGKGIERIDANGVRIEEKIDKLTMLFVADLERRAARND